MKLKKGDKVKIISGNDRGKEGKIIRVFPSDGKITVEGVQVRKKHVKARRQGQKGERIEIPMAFHQSRAMLLCGSCSKAVRVRYRIEGGRKVRVCQKCSAQL